MKNAKKNTIIHIKRKMENLIFWLISGLLVSLVSSFSPRPTNHNSFHKGSFCRDHPCFSQWFPASLTSRQSIYPNLLSSTPSLSRISSLSPALAPKIASSTSQLKLGSVGDDDPVSVSTLAIGDLLGIFTLAVNQFSSECR